MKNLLETIRSQYGSKKYEKKNIWIKYIQDQIKSSGKTYTYYYIQYLEDFFDEHFNDKGKQVVPGDYLDSDTFEQQRLDAIKAEIDAKIAKRKKRIANGRTKLNAGEKYLAFKMGIGGRSYYNGKDWVESNDMCPSEIKQRLKAYRKRVDYQAYKELNKKLGTIIDENGTVTLAVFIRKEDDAEEKLSWSDFRLLQRASWSDTAKFVEAEDSIQGLTDEEITQLHILECV